MMNKFSISYLLYVDREISTHCLEFLANRVFIFYLYGHHTSGLLNQSVDTTFLTAVNRWECSSYTSFAIGGSFESHNNI